MRRAFSFPTTSCCRIYRNRSPHRYSISPLSTPLPTREYSFLPKTRRGAGVIASGIARGSITERRFFHASIHGAIVKPFILADIGEGIRECEVIQWFVEPEARVEQFDKLCEVQSDKASVEITSRYDGVIKRLHYQVGEMALVGKPLVDIDLHDEAAAIEVEMDVVNSDISTPSAQEVQEDVTRQSDLNGSSNRTLATPAVRRIAKEHDISVSNIIGTGKDGRVLKEDVMQYIANGRTEKSTSTSPSPLAPDSTIIALTQIQSQMLKIMTKSLQIPHFLYSDEVDLTSLAALRSRLSSKTQKLTYLPFVLKAVSLSLQNYPLLNCSLLHSDNAPSSLVSKRSHNIGIAMDTPAGLIVPNIKNVAGLSILEIAQEITRLQTLGAAGKLLPRDLAGGTITVSNIGAVGGTVVAPVIVPGELAILGIGRAKRLPRFAENSDEVVASLVANFSWSADHRVVDGALMARMAESVRDRKSVV